LQRGSRILTDKERRHELQRSGGIGVRQLLESGAQRVRFHGQGGMGRENAQRRLRGLEEIGPLEQSSHPWHRHVGSKLARQARIVGRERGPNLRFRERRRDEILLPQPREHIAAFSGLLLRQAPARKRRGCKPFRVAGEQSTLKAPADEQRVGDVRRARQKQVPAPPLGQARQPIMPQGARNRLTRMAAQKPVYYGVQGIVGFFHQIAPESRHHQIIVDCIGLERGGVRWLRQIQANALHGFDERLPQAVQIARRSARGIRGSGELCTEQGEKRG
jgi:hypothetical protein